jgi:protein arginine N-methyltransferase 6
MATHAEQVIAANGLSDVITVLHSRVEDISLPCKVDVIVSEWMGFYLLHESMLPSVLTARDRWLSPNGSILPRKCAIFSSLVNMQGLYDDKVHFWDQVYGFDFSPLKSAAEELLVAKPVVQIISPEQLMSGMIVHSINHSFIFSFIFIAVEFFNLIFDQSVIYFLLHFILQSRSW